jgi:myo-inositol-1(or 4)-monophosphatase
VVTEADIRANQMITYALRKKFPNDWLLSEELDSDYNTIEGKEPLAIWVADPLDGTTNYSLGLHYWGISLAHVVDGFPDCGVLYFPLLDELYSVQRGQGAMLNGKLIQSQLPTKNRSLSFFACCSRTYRRYDVSVPYKTRILGSAAYTFCSVARGIAVVGFEATPKIWDIAAVWLLVQEAGSVIDTLGKCSPFPLLSGLDYANQSFPTLAAATSDLWIQSRQQIKPK